MKKMFFFFAFALSATYLWSQAEFQPTPEDRDFHIPLIGERAPSFTASSTNGEIHFPRDFGHSWKILFSHPKDFTPVCSTEITELAYLQDEFDKLGVKIAIVSTDPLNMHQQWKKALESLDNDKRGKIDIRFPIIDDESVTISKKYGMIHPETNSTRSVRGVFIIDPDDIVQAVYFYPMAVGRNTDELVRMVQALQTTSALKVLTPVNWKAGNDVLVPYNPIKDVSASGSVPDGYYSPAWYLWYKKENTELSKSDNQ